MDKIVECKNIWKLDRWSRYEFNHASDYERYMEADRGKKRKYRESVTNIIAHDRDYKNCNTHQIVERWDIGKEKKVTGSTAKKSRRYDKTGNKENCIK